MKTYHLFLLLFANFLTLCGQDTQEFPSRRRQIQSEGKNNFKLKYSSINLDFDPK
jgi:hypothetical protein